MSVEFLAFITTALFVIVLALLGYLFYLHKKLNSISKLFQDSKNKDSIFAMLENQEKILIQYKEIKKLIKQTSNNLKSKHTAVGLVHFNPFAGSGDNRLSFALAVLSESGDGFIISTLHHKTGTSVFAKEVKNFQPTKTISDEERQALEKAVNSLHNN